MPTLSAPSSSSLSITSAQARYLHLAAQGLAQPPSRSARREDVVAAIQRMSLLQIDSIHVIARSPYLVLFARLGPYAPMWLEDALEQGRIAECWAHEACFVTAADIGRHRAWRAQNESTHWSERMADRSRNQHAQQMDELLQHIRDNGPVRAADFERKEVAGKSGWWEWKPEKRWLEAWFASGELMVARRERFQRVYDLAEHVLARLDPAYDATASSLPHAALRQRFISDSVRALGITQARWIADYFRLKPRVTEDELAPLLATGELICTTVRGWEAVAYVHRDHATLLEKAQLGRLRATRTVLLSPFDPVVWDRVRLRAMFDFDYTIECYVPESKRRYGYFVLPILHRGQLVGRLDAKAHRNDGLFEIKSLHFEPGLDLTQRVLDELAQAIAAIARWHETPQIQLRRTFPASAARTLRRALSAI